MAKCSVNQKLSAPIHGLYRAHLMPQVRCLQTTLNAWSRRNKPNLTPLLVDGEYLTITIQRVKDYQFSRGLVADGVAGPVTLKDLGIYDPEGYVRP